MPYSRVTSRETGLITMIDLPFLWAYLTVFPVPLGHLRTPLCKISSTGEIEQRFRLN